MKKLLLFLCLFCASFSYGAITTVDYSLTRWIGTYTSIAGLPGTVTTMYISREDTTQTNIPIGFTFPYCSANYTQLSVCSNGWISLANTATWAYPSFDNFSAANMFSLGGGVGFLMPFWDDLRGVGSVAYYRTSGTSPNQVFTFQWGSPASPWLSYLGTGQATFQVKLYQTTGVIEFVYGPSTYSMKTATIGISNSYTSDYRTLPNEASVAASSSWYYSIDTTPELNTVIQWAPPCPDTLYTNRWISDSVICVGATVNIHNPDTVGGGIWVSSSVSVATVSAVTGMDTVGQVVGVAAGLTNISYILSPGCFAIKTLTVNPLPDTIAGGAQACENSTKTYTCAPGGGIWSSSNTAVGTISTTGVFGGVSSGITTLSYESSTTGCVRLLDVTVNPEVIITGWHKACLTDTTPLACTVPGGTWSSSNIARATVDAFGNVMGVSLGAVIITYTAPSGCKDTIAMTVETLCTNSVTTQGMAASKLTIYPQPTNGNFDINLPASGKASITITDLYGKTLIVRQVEGMVSDRVHFSEGQKLPAGNYIFKLVSGEQTYVEKLMIVK